MGAVIDHAKPFAAGGEHGEANFVTACNKCPPLEAAKAARLTGNLFGPTLKVPAEEEQPMARFLELVILPDDGTGEIPFAPIAQVSAEAVGEGTLGKRSVLAVVPQAMSFDELKSYLRHLRHDIDEMEGEGKVLYDVHFHRR